MTKIKILIFLSLILSFILLKNYLIPISKKNNTNREKQKKSTQTNHSRQEISKIKNYMHIVENIRRLKFKKDVNVEKINITKIKEITSVHLQSLKVSKEFMQYEFFLKYFSILKPNDSLYEIYKNLFEEQLLGYYDSTTKKLILVEDGENKETDKKAFTLSGLLKLAEEETKWLHELTHALDDQYYSIDTIAKNYPNSLDGNLSYQSLLEGSAMFTVLYYAIRKGFKVSPQKNEITRKIEEKINKLPWDSSNTGYEALDKAPRFIRNTLLFPYIFGARFFLEAYKRKNLGYINNNLFQHPPISTAEIINFDNYAKPENEKDKIKKSTCAIDSKLEKLKSAGFSVFYTNTLGVLGTSELLKSLTNSQKKMVQGWNCDSLYIFKRNDSTSLLWVTNWQSDKDAKKFMKLYKEQFNSRRQDGEKKYNRCNLTLKKIAENKFLCKNTFLNEDFIIKLIQLPDKKTIFVIEAPEGEMKLLENIFIKSTFFFGKRK